MSVRRPAAGHTLPPNPEWVEFPRTDGNPNTWPTNTTRVVAGGEINYFRVVPIDESLSVMWRKSVGAKVAEALGLPTGKAYVLKTFPVNYQLFDHQKGKVDNPRHDPYLYGSTKIGKNKFRSVNEFIPHAIWLVSDDPTAICQCKYCSGKKSQKEISESFGLSAKREGSSISTPPPRQAPRRSAPYTAPAQTQKPTVPYAALRRPPRNARQVNKAAVDLLPAPKQTLSQDKSNDIYNALTERDVQHIRYFRKGELVWCAINPPIAGPRHNEDAIQFWPGLVDVVTTKSFPVRQPNTNSDEEGPDEPDSASQSGSEPKAKITWKVHQRTSYKMKMLALAQSHILTDDDLLPYLSFAPSESLLESLRHALPQALQTQKSHELAFKPQTMSDFDPLNMSLNPVDRFAEAVAPYTLAIQIASHIATYWSPSDEWESKHIVTPPSPSPQPPPQTDGRAPTLQDILNASVQSNATPAPRAEGGHQSAPVVAQTITQLRYQGLWWGTERIWTDELVRLKLARGQFAPQGTQVVYPPAGPSKSTLEWFAAKGEHPDPALSGSSEKGMFMRIENLFVVDVPNGGAGTIKECRVSGMLYELVDADYEDPEEASQHGEPSLTNGKGKGRAQDVDIAGGSISTGPALTTDNTSMNVNSLRPEKKNSTEYRQLSRPALTAPFPLPDPPEGYRFHAVLKPGNECVLSLSLISGRYYPRLFKHPHLQSVVKKAVEVPPENGGIMLNKHLWAMEGHLPGVHQSMDPELWKPSRFTMIHDADVDARAQLGQEIEHIAEAASQQRGQTVLDSDGAGPSSAASQHYVPMDVVMGESELPIAQSSSISAAG